MSVVIYSKENKLFSKIDTEVYNQLKLFGLTDDELVKLFSKDNSYKIKILDDNAFKELDLFIKLYLDRNFRVNKFNKFREHLLGPSNVNELYKLVDEYFKKLPEILFRVLYDDRTLFKDNKGDEPLHEIKIKGRIASKIAISHFNRLVYYYFNDNKLILIQKFINHYYDKPNDKYSHVLQKMMYYMTEEHYKIDLSNKDKRSILEWLTNLLNEYLKSDRGNESFKTMVKYFKINGFKVR